MHLILTDQSSYSAVSNSNWKWVEVSCQRLTSLFSPSLSLFVCEKKQRFAHWRSFHSSFFRSLTFLIDRCVLSFSFVGSIDDLNPLTKLSVIKSSTWNRISQELRGKGDAEILYVIGSGQNNLIADWYLYRTESSLSADKGEKRRKKHFEQGQSSIDNREERHQLRSFKNKSIQKRKERAREERERRKGRFIHSHLLLLDRTEKRTPPFE